MNVIILNYLIKIIIFRFVDQGWHKWALIDLSWIWCNSSVNVFELVQSSWLIIPLLHDFFILRIVEFHYIKMIFIFIFHIRNLLRDVYFLFLVFILTRIFFNCKMSFYLPYYDITKFSKINYLIQFILNKELLEFKPSK